MNTLLDKKTLKINENRSGSQYLLLRVGTSIFITFQGSHFLSIQRFNLKVTQLSRRFDSYLVSSCLQPRIFEHDKVVSFQSSEDVVAQLVNPATGFQSHSLQRQADQSQSEFTRFSKKPQSDWPSGTTRVLGVSSPASVEIGQVLSFEDKNVGKGQFQRFGYSANSAQPSQPQGSLTLVLLEQTNSDFVRRNIGHELGRYMFQELLG